MQSVPSVLDDPAPPVRIRNLSVDGIVMEARFWTDSRRADFLATQSAVAEAIVERFQREGLPLPEPAERLLTPAELPKWRAIIEAIDGAGSH